MSSESVFLHVEIVHPDPDSAAKFLEETMGARRVEENLGQYVERFLPGSRIVHMRFANLVFQLVRPSEGLGSWQKQLDECGPSIHNISLQVPSVEEVERSMLDRGGVVYSDHQVDLREANVDVSGPLRALNIDARAQCGMRFELLPNAYGYETRPCV